VVVDFHPWWNSGNQQKIWRQRWPLRQVAHFGRDRIDLGALWLLAPLNRHVRFDPDGGAKADMAGVPRGTSFDHMQRQPKSREVAYGLESM
jgi:hypothetical protein